jgi:hypothetical protein
LGTLAAYPAVQKAMSSRLLSKTQNYDLPVILYGCQTWSLTLREEHRLGVFGNRVLRTTFGPKRKEVAGCWRRMHDEELRDFYSS